MLFKQFTRFHKTVLGVAFIIYLVTAINSKGYYHWDEHYQIIEFAGLKTGTNMSSDLAWEYAVQIRPAFQPAVCFLVFELFYTVGITDPYVLAFALRLLTLVLALVAVTAFVLSTRDQVEQRNQKAFIILSYLLWFLPFINVRFSSETWSGLLFLLGVAIWQLNGTKRTGKVVLVGVLFGLSFVCRFQIAFMIAGFLAWVVLIGKVPFKYVLILIGGATIAFLFGLLLDGWYYGRPVFTAWNYFYINIIKGVASHFGTAPWYYYLGVIAAAPTIPVGLLIITCFCLLIYKKPKLLILWVIGTFLIAHSLISHKEDRFLFPLMNFVPLILILGWEQIADIYYRYCRKPAFTITVYTVMIGLIVINVTGIVVMSFRPMGNGIRAITYYIHHHYKDRSVQLIQGAYANPYTPLYLIPLQEPFYSDDVIETDMQDVLENKVAGIDNDKPVLFVFEKDNFGDPDYEKIIAKYHLQYRMQSIPGWIEWINKWYNQSGNQRILLLYSNR